MIERKRKKREGKKKVLVEKFANTKYFALF